MLRLWSYIRTQLLGHFLKFGVVGIVGLSIDVVLFNVLSLLGPRNVAWFGTPIGAKVVSTVLAIIATWLGNRYWTFREHRRSRFLPELLEFAAVAGLGMLISLLCLWISHYILGFQTLFADNVSANVIGFALATLFRFTMYKFWVFRGHQKTGLVAPQQVEAVAAEMAIFENERFASEDATILKNKI